MQILAASDWRRRLALAGITGIAFYLALSVLLAHLRPQFSLLHNAESDYGSRGHDAWVMDVAFLVRCGLSLAVTCAIALERPRRRLTVGLGLLAVWAIGSGLLAFFPDDPAGTPLHTAGRFHLALAAIAFISVAIGTIVVSVELHRDPRWRPVGRLLPSIAWLAIVPVLLLGRTHFRLNSLGGLYERVFLGLELLWFLVAAIQVARFAPAG